MVAKKKKASYEPLNGAAFAIFNSVRRWLEESAVWTIAKRTSGENIGFK